MHICVNTHIKWTVLLCTFTSFSFFYFIFYFLYCSGFCHTLKWNSHGFTCVPHPDPPSHLPLYPIPLGLSSAPGPSTCLMHQPGLVICFTLDNIRFDAVLLKHPTLAFNPEAGDLSPKPEKTRKLLITSFSYILVFQEPTHFFLIPWKLWGFLSKFSLYYIWRNRRDEENCPYALLWVLVFSCSVVSDFLLTPWTAACQASLSLLKLMSIELMMTSSHLTSVTPFSSCLQSFPALESFPASQLFTSGGQSIGVSASASVLPMNTQADLL